MVSSFTRRGHYRTNGNGTTYWVSEHSVDKEFYSTKNKNGDNLINDRAKLLPTTCRHCYKKYFMPIYLLKDLFILIITKIL